MVLCFSHFSPPLSLSRAHSPPHFWPGHFHTLIPSTVPRDRGGQPPPPREPKRVEVAAHNPRLGKPMYNSEETLHGFINVTFMHLYYNSIITFMVVCM